MIESSRTRQEVALLMSTILIVVMVLSPWAVLAIFNGHNDSASAGTTRDYLAVRVSDVKQAWYIGTNTTGVPIKVDVTSRLNTTIFDAPNVNGAPFYGIVVTDLPLANVSQGGANETAPGSATSLVFILNHTVGELEDNTVTGAAYTFKVDAMGQYNAYKPGNATPVITDWHGPTSPDFGLHVGFAQGADAIVSLDGLDKTDGTALASNYTRTSGVSFQSLSAADAAGKAYQPAYDNPIVIKITGYKAGTGGNAADAVRFSVDLTSPNAPGAWTYKIGIPALHMLASAVVIALAIFVGPHTWLRHVPILGRRGGVRHE